MDGGRGKGSPGKGSPGKGKGGSGGKGKGKGGGRGKGDAPSPMYITSNIKNAYDFDNLFATVLKYESHFDHIHLSACWNSLGHLAARGSDRSWFQQHATALESLVQRTVDTVSTSSRIRARELANIAHGVAKSGQGSTMGPLMTALASSIAWHAGDAKPQELANTAWAFATAGHPAPEMYDALAKAATPYMSEFNPQELANIAWAFATAAHSAPALFDAVAAVAAPRLAEFTEQGLSNTVYAFAKAEHRAPALFDAVAAMAKRRLSEFTEQALANTVWAFATAGHTAPALFDAVAAAAAPRLGAFNTQAVSNMAWGFATAEHRAGALFHALAKAVPPRLMEFNPQDLATTSWAFAKACHLDEPLFSALGRAARRCLEQFNTQDLVNTAWSFAKVGQFDAELFSAVAKSIVGRRLDELTAQHLSNIAWTFSTAGQVDKVMFDALARSAEQRVSDLGAHDLSNLAWAFANAGQLDAQLFASLARSAEKLLHEFSDEQVDNAEWAFKRAGQQTIVKALRQRKKAKEGKGGAAGLAGQTAVDVSKCGRIIVAGGGIGGAAVAVALQRRGFKEVVVLESDSSFDARKQGYGLTIQRQDATQAMGINLAQDDAPSTSHYTFSSEGHILGFYGEAFGAKSKDRQEAENSGRFIHIPRQMLRKRIVEQIQSGTIKWKSKLKSFACWGDDGGSGGGGESRPRQKGAITPFGQKPATATTAAAAAPSQKENGVTVTLTDGTTIDGALLIGSDGIFSTVRRQLDLPGDRLNYVGLIVVLGIMEGKLSVPLAERRIFETVDGITRIYAMPFTTSSTMWQLSFPMSEEQANALCKDAAALKAEIVKRCGHWHEPIPSLLRGTPLDGFSGYPVYDRELLEPDVLRKAVAQQPATAPQRRVTLIGDAAHPMTPFRAQGANQALSDAVLLADCLVESVGQHGPQLGLDVALPIFEKKMLSRSARVVQGSREKAKEMHSSLALQPGRKVQREAGTGVDMPKVIKRLKAGGIGAHSAADPRGLDAVVAAAMEHSASDEREMDVIFSEVPKAKKQRIEENGAANGHGGGGGGGGGGEGGKASEWGFEWREAVSAQLTGLPEGGLRKKQLRKAVLKQFLGRLEKKSEAGDDWKWWKAHPAELKALFKKVLKKEKKAGRVRTKGKMVTCS